MRDEVKASSLIFLISTAALYDMSMLARRVQRSLVHRAVAIIISILPTPATGLGCTYLAYPDPPTEYIVSRTKTIYLGTLLQKTLSVRKAEGQKYRHHALTFRVDQLLKGEQRKTHQIEYWEKITRRSSCDEDPPETKVGEQWVIYDGYDEGDGVWNVRHPELLSWQYSPDDSGAGVLLKKIRDSVATGPSSTFFGEVELAMFDVPPGKGRTLIAELLDSDRNTVIQRADVQKGRFSFPDLNPGVYFVRLRSSRLEKLLSPETIQMQKDANGQSFYADFRIRMLPARPEFQTFALDDFR